MDWEYISDQYNCILAYLKFPNPLSKYNKPNFTSKCPIPLTHWIHKKAQLEITIILAKLDQI